MNTQEVEQALYKRWPASEHILITEAPLDPQLAEMHAAFGESE